MFIHKEENVINIKVVLAEDHEQSLEILTGFLGLTNDFKIAAIAKDGEELVEYVIKHRPDLVILDIKMPKLNGIEAIKQCKRMIPDLPFIFITAHSEFAAEAFNLEALDYIVKPIEKPRLFYALNKARKFLLQKETFPKKLAVKSGKAIYFPSLNDILYIEKVGRKTLIHTHNHVFETMDTLGSLETYLNSCFFRAHRSYIINVNNLSHIEASGKTYLAFFLHYSGKAYISKHKIDELKDLITTVSINADI